MPKVVSYRNRVFTNANRNLKDEKFRVFRCKRCQTHVVITDFELSFVPRRRTDNAPVLDRKKCVVKLNTTPVAEEVVIHRAKGIERQWHHCCSNCGLLVAYQSVPHMPTTTAADDPRPASAASAASAVSGASTSSVGSVDPAAITSATSGSTDEEPRLVYLVEDGVQWPRFRKMTPFCCKVCGYVCQDQEQLNAHFKQRGHDASGESLQMGRPRSGGSRRHPTDGGGDMTGPVPPVIVG